MRGTLHLLPAAEYPTWQAALHSQGDRFLDPVWLRGFTGKRLNLTWSPPSP
jgi:hypothetical protein